MAKIVRFYELGSADVLKIEDHPLMEPSGGEVRLKVETIGLNRAECFYREGLYLYQPKLPSLLGYEAVGIVDAVGPKVSEFNVGDRVSTIRAFKMTDYGVYGESIVVPAYAVATYPDILSAEEGASIWMQYITAFGALIEYGQMKKDDYVLLTAATGGVGIAAIQITKATGAVSIATTRSAAKKQFLKDCGADHVIVTDEEDLLSRVMEITSGQGANLIFNAVSGSLIETLADAAAPGATIFEYGIMGSQRDTPLPLMQAIQKGLKLQGYTLFEITQSLVGARKPIAFRHGTPIMREAESHRILAQELRLRGL